MLNCRGRSCVSQGDGTTRGEPDMTPKLWRAVAVTLFLGAVAAAPARSAESYPSRPPHMIVTFAAGGSSDIMARTAAKAMSEGLGENIVVENRPGAGGNVGAEYVARAAADGY